METRSVSYSRTPPHGTINGTVKVAGIPALDPASVLYLEGSGNYTIIHFSDGRKHMVAKTLMLVANQLPALIRIHKSYAIATAGIANIRWVGKTINKRVLAVTMRNKVRITASRRKGNAIAPVLAQRTGIVID